MFFYQVVSLVAIYRALFVLVSLTIFSSDTLADWNSGKTLEETDIRIAINVVKQGIDVEVEISQQTTDWLNLNIESSDKSKIQSFAESILIIKTDSILKPSLAKPANQSNIALFYPFNKHQPSQLEISPIFKLISQAGKNHSITVTHIGLPVIDHGIISQTESLLLDWQDPWYSHFSNPDLKRDHNDPVMAFMYLEPRQIKIEIVARVKELADWFNLELSDKQLIQANEFDALKQKVSQFLLEQGNIKTDSRRLTPTLERVDYIRMSAEDIQAYQPTETQQQNSTIIGISLRYDIKQLPGSVQWQWSLFSEKIQQIAIRAYDPAGLYDSYVTPDNPVFEWENMLADIDLSELAGIPKTNPVPVSEDNAQTPYAGVILLVVIASFFFLICRYIPARLRAYAQLIGLLLLSSTAFALYKTGHLKLRDNSPALTNQQANAVVNQLLWNIYQAFETPQESAAYDALANSVSGSLIETLYLQNRHAFLAQDGAWSKVKSIAIKQLDRQAESESTDGLLLDCQWLVTGDVIHWGHQHRRENLYKASLLLKPNSGYWKIYQLQTQEQQRVD